MVYERLAELKRDADEKIAALARMRPHWPLRPIRRCFNAQRLDNGRWAPLNAQKPAILVFELYALLWRPGEGWFPCHPHRIAEFYTGDLADLRQLRRVRKRYR